MDVSPDKPWHKRPDETEGDHLRFKTWLMSAWSVGGRPKERSLNKTATFLGLTPGVLRSAAARGNWTKRAAAYDSHLLAQHATGALSDLADMRARQNKLLNSGMDVLETTIERLKGAMVDKSKDKEALASIKVDLPRLMDMVLKYQNLLYGQSTENVSAKVEFGEEWDLTGLSLDELRLFNSLRSKVKRRVV